MKWKDDAHSQHSNTVWYHWTLNHCVIEQDTQISHHNISIILYNSTIVRHCEKLEKHTMRCVFQAEKGIMHKTKLL